MIKIIFYFLFVILFCSVSSAQHVEYIKDHLYIQKKASHIRSKGSGGKSVKVKLISKGSNKVYAKKKKYVAKKKAKKIKRTVASESKKNLMSKMKTCIIYNPPGKDSTIVIEATNAKRRSKKKAKCKIYRKTKKNGRSKLVIEIEEHQI